MVRRRKSWAWAIVGALLAFNVPLKAQTPQTFGSFPTAVPIGTEYVPMIGGACTSGVAPKGDCKATTASIAALGGTPGVVIVSEYTGTVYGNNDMCDKLFTAAQAAKIIYPDGAILDARGIFGTQHCAQWNIAQWPFAGGAHWAAQILLSNNLWLKSSASIVLASGTHLEGPAHGWGRTCNQSACGGTTIQVEDATTFPQYTPLIDYGYHVTPVAGQTDNPAYDIQVRDVSVSCSDFVAGVNHHVAGIIGIRNIQAQELSGGDHLEIEGCALGIDEEDPEPGTLTCPKWPLISCNGFGDASAFRDVQIFGTTGIPNTPAPATPTLGTTSGGALTSRTYYVEVTYENIPGESFASAEATQVVGANQLLTVTSPATPTASVNGTTMAVAKYYNVYVSETQQTPIAVTAASWASTHGGQITLTTASPHGKIAGDTFTVEGMTPSGYNGTFVAAAGTTGSTLVGTQFANPGAATVMGSVITKHGNRQNIFPVALGTNWTEPVQGWGNNGPLVPKVDTTYPACAVLNVPDGGLGATIEGGACTGSNLQNGFLVDGQVTAIKEIHIELGTNGRGVNIGTNSTNLLGFCAAGGPASCMQGSQFVQAGVIASHVTLTNLNLGICVTEPCAIVQNTGGNDIVMTNISNNGNGFYNNDNSYQSGAFTFFQPTLGGFAAYFDLNGIVFMSIGPSKGDGKSPAPFNPTESRMTSYLKGPVHAEALVTFDLLPDFPNPFKLAKETAANPGGDRGYELALMPGTAGVAGLLYGNTNNTSNAVILGETDIGTGNFAVMTASDFSPIVTGGCLVPPCGTWHTRATVGATGQGFIANGIFPGAYATNAAGPFIYIPGMAGTPSGSPSWNDNGSIALVYDTSAKKLWAYDPTVPGWVGFTSP